LQYPSFRAYPTFDFCSTTAFASSRLASFLLLAGEGHRLGGFYDSAGFSRAMLREGQRLFHLSERFFRRGAGLWAGWLRRSFWWEGSAGLIVAWVWIGAWGWLRTAFGFSHLFFFPSV